VIAPPPVDIPVKRVTVSPAAASVQPGLTRQFAALVEGEGDAVPDQTVVWSIAGDSPAGAAIDAAGILAVPENAEPGAAFTVRATSAVDSGKYGDAAVTVIAPPPVEIPVKSVTVSPAAASVQPGQTRQFTAQVEGEGDAAPDQSVVWSIAGNSPAGAAINAAGILAVPENAEPGATITIRAASAADSGKYGTAEVTVAAPPPLVKSVRVTPETAAVLPGQTQRFTAQVEGEGEDQPDQRVTWSIAGNSPQGTAIDAQGLLTLPEQAEPGTRFTVRAASAADSGKYGTAEVTVAAPPDIPIKRVLVSPRTASVQQGSTQQFAAQVEGYDNAMPGQGVIWSIAGEHHGETTIDENGLLQVAAAEEAGAVFTVRAASEADRSKYGSATVTITEAPSVASVEVQPATTAVAQGAIRQFNALVTVTGSAARTVEWSLEGEYQQGTSISASGVLTVAINETINSVLIVKAVSTLDSGKSGTAAVTVLENTPLPNLVGTVWRWGDRPVDVGGLDGSITIKEFVVESTDPDGVQHGHLNCYRPFDPDQQVYVDWYYYDPATKTGEIEYLTKFYILPDNSALILPQYASYPHGATFLRVYD
jgi:hypothetical protein